MTRFRYDQNRFRSAAAAPPWPEAPKGPDDVHAFHRSLPGFTETPLVSLAGLARSLGVAELWVKDERSRCGLGAFKVLGASYAVHRLMRGRGAGALTFATATDGNHGRAVAWSARRLGQAAVIFVPGNTVKARIDAIRSEGAEVVVVDGTYDEAVKRAASDSERNGWQVVSDTAYPGYTEVPAWIMEGYGTLFEESARQLERAGSREPTLVLLQAGVGGLACAGTLFYWRRGRRPTLVSVEPLDADCLRESIASPEGEIREAKGRQNSIMAGLNCGTPSLVAWPVLRGGMDGFLAIDDGYAEEAMRTLAAGQGGDPTLVSGESGAAGLAGLLALRGEPGLAAARERLGLGSSTRVLVVSTEGATDPESYERIVGARASR
ncbi:MAG: diaminopropionate ammonia-lyase [Deltaproteobacteria bacterium]